MTGPERTTRSEQPDRSASSARGGSLRQAGDTEGSKARRVTFRVVAILTSLWVLAMLVFGLTEVVFMWLPSDTLLSVLGTLDDSEFDLAHRAHFMSVGIVAWSLVLGVLVQLRRPERREAPMLHALAVVIAGSVLHALSGTLGDWLLQDLTLLAPLVLLGFLHPRARHLLRISAWDRSMAALAAIAAVPWLVFAASQAQQQWRNVAGDTHAEMGHWAIVAVMAVMVVACSFIGATDRSGWRLTAWIAAVASINYGLHSLVFPEPASAASMPWAIAALAWGVVYAASIIRRSRRAPSTTLAA